MNRTYSDNAANRVAGACIAALALVPALAFAGVGAQPLATVPCARLLAQSMCSRARAAVRYRRQAAADVVIRTTRDVTSGARLEYRVLATRLQHTKNWSPERQSPPLPIPAAVGIAKKHSKPRHVQDLQVLSIELALVDAGGTHRWYYLIRLYDLTHAQGDTLPAVTSVLVLMDGSVVEPRALS